MSLTAGTRLGPYEIASPIGAGGMGEVYKARDTRLDRTVAIKILSPDFASNNSLKQRFEREAKTISQLNHPNICVVHDVGNEAGLDYLVMEYVEGESLADRLARGALSTDEALRYSIQIADALGKAHRQGIIHRDLKPGNVMLTKSGAKLLDFGLAKFSTSELSPVEGLTTMPTEHKPLTQEGTILGTFQYMAPEQLEGLDADARTDIFALGCVMYEMATGKRAFQGKSKASLIAAILGAEPQAITQLQPLTPPAFEHVIERCLEKDPADRWQSAHDIAEELRWISEAGSQAGVATPITLRRKSRERLAWWLQPIVALVAIAATWLVIEMRRENRVVYSEISPPENHEFSFNSGPVAMSPDGKRIAFLASQPGGKRSLWIRSLDEPSAKPLAGTEDAAHPFWSPDSTYVGFFAGGKLKKISIDGGPPQTLCDTPRGFGGSWSSSGVILFAGALNGPIMKVPANGGIATEATKLDQTQNETSHRFPSFLPDGRHFLFLLLKTTGLAEQSETIGVASLDSDFRKTIMKSDSTTFYVPPGYLFNWRDRMLVAQPFDVEKLELTGEAFPVADSVVKPFRFVIASASRNGALVYQSGLSSDTSQLVWFDRTGKKLESVGKPADYLSPSLSHDGSRVAVEIVDPGTSRSDIWVLDQIRGTSMRLTFDPANDRLARWSHDDSKILFTSDRKSLGDVFVKRSAGIGSEEEYLPNQPGSAISDISRDGNLVVFTKSDPKTDGDIYLYSPREKKTSVFIQTPYYEGLAKLSPDRRFLAYVSNESGTSQVYVQDLAGEGGKWQISTDGGSFPRWRRDGRELFFTALLTSEVKLYSVDVTTMPTFQAGIPKELCTLPSKRVRGYQYDVSADGQKFLVNTPLEDKTTSSLTLVQNWIASVKK